MKPKTKLKNLIQMFEYLEDHSKNFKNSWLSGWRSYLGLRTDEQIALIEGLLIYQNFDPGLCLRSFMREFKVSKYDALKSDTDTLLGKAYGKITEQKSYYNR